MCCFCLGDHLLESCTQNICGKCGETGHSTEVCKWSSNK